MNYCTLYPIAAKLMLVGVWDYLYIPNSHAVHGVYFTLTPFTVSNRTRPLVKCNPLDCRWRGAPEVTERGKEEISINSYQRQLIS